MALMLDGFEQFKQTDRPETLMRLAGYSITGTTAIVAGRKTGGQAVSAYRGYIERSWTVGGSVVSMGFASKQDVRGPLLGVYVGTATNPALLVRTDTTTALVNVANNPGYVAPLLNRWYYYELELDWTNSVVNLYVNGKLDNTVALPADIQSAAVIKFRFNPYDTVTTDYGTRLMDDMYISDSARLNPLQITTRFPTATPTEQWNNAGASTAHEAVTPPVDQLNKYIYSGTADAEDQFTSSNTLPDSNPIRYLQLITLFRKATSDPMSLEVNIGDDMATITNIPRDWTYAYTPMPATGYDSSNIIGTEFGVKLKL